MPHGVCELTVWHCAGVRPRLLTKNMSRLTDTKRLQGEREREREREMGRERERESERGGDRDGGRGANVQQTNPCYRPFTLSLSLSLSTEHLVLTLFVCVHHLSLLFPPTLLPHVPSASLSLSLPPSLPLFPLT